MMTIRSPKSSGRVLRDNVWGTLRRRCPAPGLSRSTRCITVSSDFSIRDYAGGVEDIEARQLRLIGDPEQRYREDPVRMLRAARFAAKLDFDIEPGTAAADQRACAPARQYSRRLVVR